MNRTADRNGAVTQEHSVQDRVLEALYGSRAGRLLLRPLVTPAFSRLGGRLLDTRLSALLIGPFVRAAGVDMSQYERRRYRSYNDFFTRRLAPGARTVRREPDCLISPCDGRLSVCEIGPGCAFQVKHTRYTAAALLCSHRLAERFRGGYAWIFRLCVDDYHRYIYPDGGVKSSNFRIPGVFHTVNPIANDSFPVYKENTREYTLLRTEHFGTVLMMEVGALLVGKIENRHGAGTVRRGQEKGNFAFGGSTIILLTQRGLAAPDRDILRNSRRGIETRVRLGERVGGR